jgi:4-hydroxy-tetrahydrodipicolinate synthase
MKLKGIIPPMTTPFHENGEIDEAAFCQDVDYLLQAGVHGLAVGGSTGEGHTLSREELVQLVEKAVLQASGKVPIIAGIIADSTREVIARGKAVADLGAAALQITPVHYLFTPDEQAMYDYYARISDSLWLPIIIYNVIPWSYCSPALLVRMIKEIDHVIGVKQSAGDMHALAELLLLLQGDGTVLAAVDDLL